MTFWPKIQDEPFNMKRSQEILKQLNRIFDESKLQKMVESKGSLPIQEQGDEKEPEKVVSKAQLVEFANKKCEVMIKRVE